jgi:cell division protein ZapA (FtsZ GTPase activity inhibitor)
MFKIEGLDKLTRDLDAAQKALGELNGELGSVSMDPHDPASIEAAIQEAARLIDERVAPYASNPLVAQLVESIKENQREGLLERAAAARLEKDAN